MAIMLMVEINNKQKKLLIEAGKLAEKAALFAREKALAGETFFEIAESTEQYIIKKGAIPAFPVNLSNNNVAAHDTAAMNDKRTFESKKDLLKIDVGVCLEGLIADTAITVTENESLENLILASVTALKKSILVVLNKKHETTISAIGTEIEKHIKLAGFKPIENLTGHAIGIYKCHESPSIPNYNTNINLSIGKGIFAIEPFATNALKPQVHEESSLHIFEFKREAPVRNLLARKILALAKQEFKGLPFAERWLYNYMKINSQLQLKLALKELISRGALYAHNVLAVSKGFYVSQAEATLLVTENEALVIANPSENLYK